MGRFFAGFSSVVAPARLQSQTLAQQHATAFWSGSEIGPWISSLTAAGVSVTPDLALTLSALYSGVTMIGSDLATCPLQTFQVRDDGGKDRVRPFYGAGIDANNGIRSLAYMLRWQPNFVQTAVEFWLSLIAQFLLRGVAYAEIASGPTGFVEQLLPRHPDRIRVERLPSGRLRFRLHEGGGQARYLTQDEMLVIRDLTFDGGLSPVSRVTVGAEAIGAALATQRAAAKFFKSGMTAAVVATYTGEMDEEGEAALHASISRYAAGVDNSFGLMLIPDDVKVSNLAVSPEKAQMMSSQEWGVREVARLLRMPGSKLGIADSKSYANQVQEALDYIMTCLRPIAVAFEQAIQRDLILAKDTYTSEFLLEALMRGDFGQQAEYLEKFIRSRILRPSEARVILNRNPDPELDRLSEGDFRPGASAPAAPVKESREDPSRRGSRAEVKALLAVHDNALRCVRRERHRVTQLAEKHASDVPGWQSALRDFYADQAHFVAQTMRVPLDTARTYAAQHGAAFEAHGLTLIAGEDGERWMTSEADELCVLALYGVQEAA